MTANAWLMQFQADVLGIPVEVAAEPEQTALGAALARRARGRPLAEPQAAPAGARYEPRMQRDEAERLYAGWREALRRTLL